MRSSKDSTASYGFMNLASYTFHFSCGQTRVILYSYFTTELALSLAEITGMSSNCSQRFKCLCCSAPTLSCWQLLILIFRLVLCEIFILSLIFVCCVAQEPQDKCSESKSCFDLTMYLPSMSFCSILRS